MTQSQAIAAFLAATILLPAGAGAGTVHAGPNPCPAQAAADPYETPSDVSADPDASAWAYESIEIVRYVPLGKAGLYARIALDMATGLPYGADALSPAPCDARRPMDKARGGS